MTMRTQAEIESLFDGFVVQEPGVVPIQRWHPDSDSEARQQIERMVGFAGVGVKEIAR
jgi:hypothetical protein